MSALSLDRSNPAAGRSVRQAIESLPPGVLEEALELEVRTVAAANPNADPDTSPLPQHSPAGQLLAYMGDPAYSQIKDVTKLLQKSGMTYVGLMEILRKRDIAVALFTSGSRMAEVLDGVAYDASPRMVTCTSCWGEGIRETGELAGDPDEGEDLVPETAGCRECEGSGKRRVPGDKEAAKLFLSVHGLIKSGGGNAVNVQVQQGVKVEGAQAESKQERITRRVQQVFEQSGSGS